MTASFSRLPAVGLIGLACIATATMATAFARARDTVLGAISWAVAFVFDVLARPVNIGPAFAFANLTGGPALAYDGPPVHSLRHEAGVSRRSAARNT